jgi:hypothetical protein
MAVIQKTLFAKNLDRYAVLVNDTEPNSRYFKITELPDTFTGGKNAFLIAGSTELIADTKIQIELKDAAGNIIYHEPGEGYISSSLNGTPFITEYYEGVSKVVSVYIYPDTAYGPCTLTILGELSQYEDTNGITIPVPSNWENQYNVKWTKTINVNPNLANTTRVRFYERPNVSIKEILSPIYRIENDIKVNSGVSQSFANIKLSKLETFAGDVKRIKVFRTSEGDISDYDLIQDILVESKELLTSYGLTGSVVGQTGILTSETLKSFWNTGSLNAYLTSSRVESGVRLTGSGNFTYTSSLDIRSANTYELNFDVFYSSSTNSNLGIYLASGSTSSSIGTLYGISPTKNLLDTVIPFKISTDYPTASLYFSQSQGEWHLGNISLKLSQDTAFSPDEISFITTMPTVIGNETFNFKFEFYDVNNNYVPVSVTQSATFTGGVNVNNTLLLVSASASQSLAALAAVSSSISGTMTVYSSSASSSVNILSGSVSGTIGSVSSSVSGTIGSVSSSVSGTIGRVSGSISSSIYSLSGSVSSSLTLTSGSIILLSGSFLQFTQSITSSLTSLSQSVSSSFFNVSGAINAATASLSSSMSASLSYQVYSASQYLDKFIFTDDKGKINSPPTASDPGLYLGSTYLGYYNGTGTSGWKTYMADNGNFYLTSSIVGGGLLAWNAAAATLQINGSINIQGGNAATTSSVSASINSATSSLSSSVATTTFTTATGLIAKPPTVLVGSTSGLYLGSTYLGYYDGSNWKTYMANNGNFYLSGTGTNGLTWNGSTLSITGTIKVSDGTEVTNATINGAAAGATALQNSDTGKSLGLTGGSVGGVTIASNKIYVGTGTWGNSNTGFYVDNTGQMSLKDKLTWDGTTLSITGNIVITGGSTKTAIDDAAAAASSAASAASTAQGTANSAASAASTAQTTADGKLSPGSAASDVNNNTTTISGGKIRTGKIQSNNISGTDDGSGYSSAGMSIDLTGGGISAKNFRITAGGDAFFRGDVTATGGNFSGNITSTATISGGTISGGSIVGGSLNIGGNFSVSSTGTLTAVNAVLSGSVNAAAGNIGGFTLSPNAFSTSNGKLKIDTATPAILLYETNGGSPKVEINAANALTNPANSNVNPQWSGNGGYVDTDGNRTATESTGYGNITSFYGTISDAIAINFSGLVTFNVYTPDLVVSVNSGTISATTAYPPYSPQYTYQTYQSSYASARRAEAYFVMELLDGSNNVVATSAQVGPSVYAWGASSYSYYQSNDGVNWQYYSYSSAGSATARQSFTMRSSTITIPSSGTYKVRMVLKLSVTPGYISNYETNVTTYYSATGTSNHSYQNASPSLTPNLNKVEITNGGIQVLTTTDSYVKMERQSDSGWSGGTLFQAVGGIIRGQAYGQYPTYLSSYGMNIDGYVNLNGISNNTIGTMDYTTGNSGYTVLTINGKYSETTKANQAKVDIACNVRPYIDDRMDLGDTSYRWRDIFTNGNVTTTSDRTKKTNITPSNLGLEFINKLTPVSYKFISGSVVHEENWPMHIEKELKAGERDEFNNILKEDKIVLIPNPEHPPVIDVIPGKRTHYGLIAQDVKAVLDEMQIPTSDFGGYVAGDIENDTELGLRYEQFLSPMIKAIQELSNKVNELEAKLSGSI